MNVEDILRSHGLGVGSGVEVVTSETEPTTGLQDGLFWHEPVTKQTKMYINGAFENIGGKGSIFTEISNQVTLPADSTGVTHGLSSFNKEQDLLMVYKGGTFLKRDVEYTLNADGLGISAVSETWPAGTIFDFVAITNTTIPQTDNLTMLTFESDYVVSVDNITNIPINISQYNPLTDVLHVYLEGLRVYKGSHWDLNVNNTSIDIIGGTARVTDQYHFTVYKKLRDAAPAGTIDGATQLIDGSVNYAKLAADVKEKISNNELNISNLQSDVTGLSGEVNDLNTLTGSYSVYKSGKDANGLYTIVEWKRPDQTLYKKSLLSNPDASGNYQTQTIDFYGTDGLTVSSTEVWTITYDADGVIISEVKA